MVEVTRKSGGFGGKALGCLGVVVLGVIGLGMLGSQVEEEFEAANSAEAAADGGSTEAVADDTADDTPPSNWTYHERKDDLRGTTDYFADIVSENEVEFDFPYAGGSRLRLTVRNTKAYGGDVILAISDGQFVCGVYDCSGMISFDGAAEKLSLTPPDDHDSKTLFATYDEAILRKLKSADKVVVELPFYQEGNRQFTFETAGLEWDH